MEEIWREAAKCAAISFQPPPSLPLSSFSSPIEVTEASSASSSSSSSSSFSPSSSSSFSSRSLSLSSFRVNTSATPPFQNKKCSLPSSSPHHHHLLLFLLLLLLLVPPIKDECPASDTHEEEEEEEEEGLSLSFPFLHKLSMGRCVLSLSLPLARDSLPFPPFNSLISFFSLPPHFHHAASRLWRMRGREQLASREEGGGGGGREESIDCRFFWPPPTASSSSS